MRTCQTEAWLCWPGWESGGAEGWFLQAGLGGGIHPAFSSPGPWVLHLPDLPPSLISLTPTNVGPSFQAQSHQVAGRSFQIKPFEMRQQHKQSSGRRWQTLQVRAERSMRGQNGWGVCVCV